MTITRPDTNLALRPTPDAVRPAAHFTAAESWLNDPNGLLYHDGVYHLFFQTNPHGDTWGNISWGHATSTDLVTWDEQAIAIPCTPEEMAFSGSAVADVRNTAGFAGPGQTALVAIYTSAKVPEANRPPLQSQSLAFSLDGGSTWNRYAGNPVLDIGSAEFRDPKVFWYGGDDGYWVMVVVEAVERRVAIYTSPNLIAWTRRSHFGPAHAVGGVWECPDLFPLRIRDTDETKWVLIVSLNPGAIAGGSGTQYFVGDFDGDAFTAETIVTSDKLEDFDWLDYGRDYYAAVSFNDVPDERRLMIGWANNWQYAELTPTSPWRSAMSLVREVELIRCADGRLRLSQRPVLPAENEGVGVFDVSVPCAAGDRTSLILGSAKGSGEELVITVDGSARSITCDRTRSGDVSFHADFPSVDWAPLPTDAVDGVDLLIVVDSTIVEIFSAGGLVTFTEQVFPGDALTELHIERATPKHRSE